MPAAGSLRFFSDLSEKGVCEGGVCCLEACVLKQLKVGPHVGRPGNPARIYTTARRGVSESLSQQMRATWVSSRLVSQGLPQYPAQPYWM